MHQSWMFFIHWFQVLTQLSGTKRTSPLSTSLIARPAIDSPSRPGLVIAMNH